jgi:DNA-binding SARP family transcriptional activator
VAESQRLQLRVLGELEVIRAGQAVALPQSRKARALLAYLALTGRTHRRERLCELLWDVADDRRGALRWCLSKIRPIVDCDDVRRVVADRDSVSFNPAGVSIDLHEVRAQCRDLTAATTDAVQRAADRFRGEVLEGLDLHDFAEYQAWCVALREEALRLRVQVAEALVARLDRDPARAAVHARVLVQADPLDVTARTRLIHLLAAAGRDLEVEQQLDAARRAFAELGGDGPDRLRQLDAALADKPARSARATPMPSPPAVDRRRPAPVFRTTVHGLRMVGRAAERARLAAVLARARPGRAAVAFIRGEPGVGKSRMLVDFMTEARRQRGATVEGCAYEAERSRPYGPWIDALRRLTCAGHEPDDELTGLLAGTVNEAPASRERLFVAVTEQLARWADTGAGPALVALDDLQWFDDSSVQLLHYLVRVFWPVPVVVAVTARGGELADNPAALRTLRSLRREGVFDEVEVGPLSRDETRELIGLLHSRADGDQDVDQIYRDSGGNPLFALELARAVPRTGGHLAGSLSTVVRDRLDRLPGPAADVLRWAAVLGPVFRVRALANLVTTEAEALADALDDLERHALIGGVVDTRDPGGTYQFAHQLVHQVVYSDLSVARRRLMHARVAAALAAEADAGDAAAADLAHHAIEAGDIRTATAAALRAARHCLRVFAPDQALALARRGRRWADALDEPARAQHIAELEALIGQARAALAQRATT